MDEDVTATETRRTSKYLYGVKQLKDHSTIPDIVRKFARQHRSCLALYLMDRTMLFVVIVHCHFRGSRRIIEYKKVGPYLAIHIIVIKFGF